MKNFEKYIDFIIPALYERFAVDKKTLKAHYCCNIDCSNCMFKPGSDGCRNERKKFLLAEESEPDLPKLTEFDRQYLRFCLECGYKYIARDKGEYLYAYKTLPEYNTEMELFGSDEEEYRECLTQVASEIKCGEFYKITDLLGVKNG